jgi:hypothetical protein
MSYNKIQLETLKDQIMSNCGKIRDILNTKYEVSYGQEAYLYNDYKYIRSTIDRLLSEACSLKHDHADSDFFNKCCTLTSFVDQLNSSQAKHNFEKFRNFCIQHEGYRCIQKIDERYDFKNVILDTSVTEVVKHSLHCSCNITSWKHIVNKLNRRIK